MSGNRIGYVNNVNQHAYVKDGTLGGGWTDEFTAATLIALSGRRIAAVSNTGSVYFKDGDLNNAWTLVGTGCVRGGASC